MTDAVTPEERARFAADLRAVGVRDGDRLAVAVSGGADSLALLLLAATSHGDVAAATVDHGLRPAAADEAAMVAGVCDGLAIRHETLRVTVEDRGRGLQAAARTARYAALDGWVREAGAAALATAHHADDQAETFLMRAARGAGVAGLAGVRRRIARPGGPAIVRPLLGWRRRHLALIVDRAGLTAIDDPSNHDDRFDRTRMRRTLLAHEDVLMPERIATAASWLAEAEEALAWHADRLFGERTRWVADGDEDVLLLDPTDLPGETIRRLVRDCFQEAQDRVTCGAWAWEPPGPDLARLIARVSAGDHATLGRIKVSPGPLWRFEAAPPHRSG
ncbi:MAG: tRNA lysidine(34) synthetase TilS [Sphingomonas fennica]